MSTNTCSPWIRRVIEKSISLTILFLIGIAAVLHDECMNNGTLTKEAWLKRVAKLCGVTAKDIEDQAGDEPSEEYKAGKTPEEYAVLWQHSQE